MDEIVDQKLADLMRGLDCFHTAIWNDLTSIQQQMLLAAIENNGYLSPVDSDFASN